MLVLMESCKLLFQKSRYGYDMEFQVSTLAVSATQQTIFHKQTHFAVTVWKETEQSIPFLLITY